MFEAESSIAPDINPSLLDLLNCSDDSIKDVDYVPDSQTHSQGSINNQDEDSIANQESSIIVHKPWNRIDRQQRKTDRNHGKAYKTNNNISKCGRKLKLLHPCRKSCVISPAIQKELFEKYWSLGSRDQRAVFVGNLINQENKKRERKNTATEKPKTRMLSHVYFFEVNGKREKVCKNCFKSTLDETDGFIRTVLQKKQQSMSGVLEADRRGRHTPSHKTSSDVVDAVKDHIKSFPAYQSHYTRKTNDKRILQSSLNLTKMFALYKESVQTQYVSRTIYEREFHKMKLTFKRPQQDTCHTCDGLRMKIKVSEDEKNQEELCRLKVLLEEHHNEAEMAYQSKKNDKIEAQNDVTKGCFAFDLQQCLPTPKLSTSIAFYKRQLWTFNLTVHNLADGSSVNYMWHEGIAGRGANEIASCLFLHLKNLPNNIKSVKFYSDTCGGQNKNTFVVAMFLLSMQTLNNGIEIADHKFLIPGHTHMECDIDHAIIEKKQTKISAELYHPHDWYQLVRSCGTRGQFHVHELLGSEVFNFSELLNSKSSYVVRKKDENGNVFRFQQIKWLQYRKNENGKVYFKTTIDDKADFRCVSFNRRGKHSLNISLKYAEPPPISEEKKKDILSLLEYIPVTFHEFYKKLQSKSMGDTDPDLEEDSSSEEF